MLDQEVQLSPPLRSTDEDRAEAVATFEAS